MHPPSTKSLRARTLHPVPTLRLALHRNKDRGAGVLGPSGPSSRAIVRLEWRRRTAACFKCHRCAPPFDFHVRFLPALHLELKLAQIQLVLQFAKQFIPNAPLIAQLNRSLPFDS